VTNSVDELYFRWLYKQVGSVTEKNPARSYGSLLKQLHNKEFAWFVPNDHNRAADGRDLRIIFLQQSGIFPEEGWVDLGCSVLEMILALAHRLSFEDGQKAKVWFWRLLNNLGIDELTDESYGDQTEEAVDEILNNLIWRTYEPDGLGGLFPLEHPQEDQREVEIWYQLSAYLLES
jgi:hypothetical protein